MTEFNHPVVDGIARVLTNEEINGSNRKYQALYDRIAWCYDGLIKLARLFLGEGSVSPVQAFLDDLNIQKGERVLEVSVGTGANILTLPKDADYYGIDISLGMLRKAQKNLKRRGRSAYLAHAAAESLPFEDNFFDVVFHSGGFNFFTDRQQAINEMIRVAKPGARLLIADETEETAKMGEKLPIAKWFFKGRDEVIEPPIDLLPPNIVDPKVSYTKQNTLYVVTFTKGS